MTVATRAVYPHIVAAVFNRPWAVHPDTMSIITEIVSGRSEGFRFEPAEIEARILAASETHGPRGGGRTSSAISVIPVYGVISPRAGLMSNSSGGASVEGIRRSLRAAMADPEIDGVVLDIDSPGGAVDALPELAAELYAMRGNGKPVTAVANTNAFSAAYWLGTQADALYVSPSGSVGSIGVIAAHEDHSEALAMEGIKPTFITSSPYKAEGNMTEPLTDEAREAIQHDVDAYHEMFIDAVVDGRGVDHKTVNETFGQGRTVMAKEAFERGMVDGVMTLEDAITATAQRSVDYAEAAAAAQSPWSVVGASGLSDVAQTVLSLPQAKLTWKPLGPETFAQRLDRVLGEAQALAVHAKERGELRAEEGRTLSAGTLEQLAGLRESLGALVAAPQAIEPGPGARVAALTAFEKKYQ